MKWNLVLCPAILRIAVIVSLLLPGCSMPQTCNSGCRNTLQRYADSQAAKVKCKSPNGTATPCMDIPILFLQPLNTDDYPGGASTVVGFYSMLERINERQHLLPGYRIVTNLWDTEHSVDRAKEAYLNISRSNSRWAALFTAGTPATLVGVRDFAAQYVNTLGIYTAAHGQVHNPRLYPDAFNWWIDDVTAMVPPMIIMMKEVGWRNLIVITERSMGKINNDRPDNSGRIGDLLEEARQNGTIDNFEQAFVLWDSTKDVDVGAGGGAAAVVLENNYRILMFDGNVEPYDYVICELYKAGRSGYLVFVRGYFPKYVYDEKEAAKQPGTTSNGCNYTQLLSVAQVFVAASPSFLGGSVPEDIKLTCDDRVTTAQAHESAMALGNKLSTQATDPIGPFPWPGNRFVSFYMDPICQWALMARHMLVEPGRYTLDDLLKPTGAIMSEMTKTIKNQVFDGMSGTVLFDGGPLRQWELSMRQATPDGITVYAEYSPLKASKGQNPFTLTKDMWWKSGMKPGDSFQECRRGEVAYGDVCKVCPANTLFIEHGGRKCICRAGFWAVPSGNSIADCNACPIGRFSDMPGNAEKQSKCKKCSAGKFTNSEAATECSACPVGKFQPHESAIMCIKCPALTITSESGSTGEEQCVCDKGLYEVVDDVGRHCRDCAEYFPGGSVSCSGYGALPQLQPGFMTFENSSIVYRCAQPGAKESCPGGVAIGTMKCSEHSSGIACAQCQDGYHFQHGTGLCALCKEGSSWVIPVVIGCAFLVFMVKLRPGEVEFTEDSFKGVMEDTFITQPISQVLEVAQLFAVFSSLSVSWPKFAFDHFAFISGLLKFSQPLSTQCMLAGNPDSKPFQIVLFVNLAPAFILVTACLATLPSRISERARRLRFPTPESAFNVTLGLLHTFFTAILNAAISFVFSRYEQPGAGARSLKAFPFLSSADDRVTHLEVVAWASLTLWCLGTFLYTLILVYLVESDKASRSTHISTISLAFTFRKQCMWWILEELIVKCCISATPMIAYTAAAQLKWITAVLVVHLSAVIYVKPFRYHRHTGSEAALTLGKIMLTICSQSPSLDEASVGHGVAITICLLWLYCGIYLVWCAWDYRKRNFLHVSRDSHLSASFHARFDKHLPGTSVADLLPQESKLRKSIQGHEILTSHSVNSHDDDEQTGVSKGDGTNARAEKNQTSEKGVNTSAILSRTLPRHFSL